MTEVQTTYKVAIWQRGRKIKHLAEALAMPYTKVGRILNGFDAVPLGFGKRVVVVLEQWDAEAELIRKSRSAT